MKELVILGAGTGGTITAHQARRRLGDDWRVTVVDPDPRHLYQPGLLFLPFGARDENHMLRPRAATLDPEVRWLEDGARAVDTEGRRVELAGGGSLHYDLLVLASGSRIRPGETEGLAGPHWHRSIHDFYTLDGARTLRDALARFDGGRLVVNVVEMPIKCPVAPLEFLFLADAFFTRRGIRDRVELVYATPLDGAFTKPLASRLLGSMLEEKGIEVVADFATGSVDGEGRMLTSWDERQVPYDLLVSIPTHMGADFIAESGLGDELAFVPTEPHTLRAKGHEDVFVIGDATDVAASKAGSVAHFEADVVAENLVRTIRGEELEEGFDGHANCFIESGHGKGLLIDFNYDTQPLPGHYPLPWVGPFRLMKESRFNHWGKLAFRWAYWNLLLPARPMPVPNRMSTLGKRTSVATPAAKAA